MSGRQQFVGEFTGERVNGLAEVAVKNRFEVNNKVEMMTPQGNINFTIETLKNKKNEDISVAPGDGHIVYIPIPDDVNLQYALLMKYV